MAKKILTPFQVLGITDGATVEAIKSAFRRKSMKCHPDVCSDKKAAETFRELYAARDTALAMATPQRRHARDSIFF